LNRPASFTSGLLFWFKDLHLFRSQFLNLLRSAALMLLLSRIFKVALLFICQGSKTALRAAFLLFIFATALLEYHSFFTLSTIFFKFFSFF